jgi:hypothetical protein
MREEDAVVVTTIQDFMSRKEEMDLKKENTIALGLIYRRKARLRANRDLHIDHRRK